MSTFRCLVVSDSKHTEQYGNLLRCVWEDELYAAASIDCVALNDPSRVVSTLASGGFHLLLCDILFKVDRSWEERGLVCIRQARREYQGLAIVAMDNNEQREEAAIRAGADAFVLKRVLLGNEDAVDRLANLLRQLLAGRSPELLRPAVAVSTSPGDLPAEALVERIGGDTLARMGLRIFKKPTELKATFVRSGLSGAVVLGLGGSDADGPLIDRLLKLAKDERGALDHEVNQRALLQDWFQHGSFVQFESAPSRLEDGGWRAISSPYVKGRTALVYLVSQPGLDASKRMTERLVDKLSTRGHVDASGVGADVHLFQRLVRPRVGRISLAIEDLAHLAKTHGGIDDDALSSLRNYLRSDGRLMPDTGSGLGNSFFLRCSHGDLHARNVLVDEEDRPWLIDPANLTTLHWAADVARFVVDLFVSGWEAPIGHHEWLKLKDWRGLCRHWLEGNGLGATAPGNEAIHAALGWTEAQFERVFGAAWKPKRTWEYRLAMAMEFLRSSYRESDLPAPKRVLGLIVGYDGLQIATSLAKKALC